MIRGKHLMVLHDLAAAHEMAIAGYWTSDRCGYHMRELEKHLSKVADILGFDLVKRQTPQEAHEAMIAKRVAENTADEVIGFR